LQLDLETEGRVFSTGAQVRLLPRVGGVGDGRDSLQTLPASVADRAEDDNPSPVAGTEESSSTLGSGADDDSSVDLVSPGTLLKFWLPMILGLGLVVVGLIRSRSEKHEMPMTEPLGHEMFESMTGSNRSLGADQIYQNKGDEPEAGAEPGAGSAKTDSGSSSFSLSLPGAGDAQASEPQREKGASPSEVEPTSKFPLADFTSKPVAAPLALEDNSPLPSIASEQSAASEVRPPKEFMDGNGGPSTGRPLYTLAPRVVRFVVLRGRNKGKQYRSLLRQKLVVGSRSTADLVVVGEVNVGAEQFELTQDGGDVIIRNLNDERPTLINGLDMETGQRLQAGDLVGNEDVIFRTVLGD